MSGSWSHILQCRTLGTGQSCLRAADTADHLHGTEIERLRRLTRNLFSLRKHADFGRMLADGRLIRSPRTARLEAVLLIADSPLTPRKLVNLAKLIDASELQELIRVLNHSYTRTHSAFRVVETAGGFQMMTQPELSAWLDRLHERQARMKLSQPMQETLTIIAYRQPVTRAEVEQIRGVQSTDMIRQLIDRGLIRVGGEDNSLGRPFLYVTTNAFLEMFGLGSIEEMPDYETMKRQPRTVVPMSAPSGEATTGPDEATAA